MPRARRAGPEVGRGRWVFSLKYTQANLTMGIRICGYAREEKIRRPFGDLNFHLFFQESGSRIALDDARTRTKLRGCHFGLRGWKTETGFPLPQRCRGVRKVPCVNIWARRLVVGAGGPDLPRGRGAQKRLSVEQGGARASRALRVATYAHKPRCTCLKLHVSIHI